jgi:hypothetical protein
MNENPPLRNQKYLITTAFGEIDFAYWNDTNIYGRSCGEFRWTVNPYTKPIAWTELPKPYFKKQDMIEELEEYIRSQGDVWDKSVVDGAINIIKSYCGGNEE